MAPKRRGKAGKQISEESGVQNRVDDVVQTSVLVCRCARQGMYSFQPPQVSQQSSRQKFKPKEKQFKNKSSSTSSGFDSFGGGSSREVFCGQCGGRHPTTQCVGVQGVCHICGKHENFARAPSVIPRGSWGDLVRSFTMIRWLFLVLLKRSKLGMDVLTNYRASVDCFHGMVRFRPKFGEKWDIYGTDSQSKIRLVSAMEMFGLLSLENFGFMIYALDVLLEHATDPDHAPGAQRKF
ncbi:hypothetical protein F511_41213 [Dorcoceras hygrometricum]|uniref:Uncharacterized protein n=1 Tax=Dorcoceras hygrometricum TaxID=472368 RepID=A0A2Z7CS48_9LAMI|nr:hypothetical protein F511_41213 [Dorcoceras hygrometricum]